MNQSSSADVAALMKQASELRAQHKIVDAANKLVEASQIAPESRGVWNTLGEVYLILGLGELAEQAYQKVLALNPADTASFINIGVALDAQGKKSDAAAAYTKALAGTRERAAAYSNRGGIFKDQGRIGDALIDFQRALAEDPTQHAAASNYLFGLCYGDGVNRSDLLDAHMKWACRYADPITARARRHRNSKQPDRVLKIGYFSPDFHFHPVSYFMLPLLVAHDRQKFHITCFNAHRRSDELTEILKKNSNAWADVGHMGDDELSELIRAQEIDILVDLAGHTAHNRLPALAQKPAPIQLTYLGYPTTTGMAAIDYRFSDAWVDPLPDASHEFSEKLLHIEGGFLCYQAAENVPSVSGPAFKRQGYVTFGCYNNTAKLSKSTLKLWGQILQRVPTARLRIKSLQLSDQGTRLLMEQRLIDAGCPPDRLDIIAPNERALGHMAAHRDIDIALDSFPYNGTTTTCDALWMGVPVIAMQGARSAARVGCSILQAAGLPDLIAESPQDYVEKAVALAMNPKRLSQLRMTLRPQMALSALCRPKRLAGAIEAHYRKIWQDWCAGA